MATMIHFHPAYQNYLQQQGITDIAALERICSGDDLISLSAHSYVWKRHIGDISVYAKKYEYSTRLWRYFLRPSRGSKEFASYGHLEQIGILCPEVLCFAENREWGRLTWTILLTREVAEATDLHALFAENKLSQPQRVAILAELGEIAARMHRHNFFAHDFKLRNILYQPGNGDAGKIYLIDLPRGDKRMFYSRRAALWDLVTLYKHAHSLCRDDEWRLFLEKYAAASSASYAKWQAAITAKFRSKYRCKPTD